MRVLQNVRDMTALHVENMRNVRTETDLRQTDDETVREAVRLHAEHRGHAVTPFFAERDTVPPIHLISGATLQRRANLEATRVDDAIQFVFEAVRNYAARRDAFDAAAVGIDKRDIGAIERL